MLPFIVAGIVAGSIYGLASTGLVLSYKTSGIFNFGQGALATAGAYIFYAMYINGLGWLPATLITVFVAGPVLGVVLELVARRLTYQRAIWKIVGTVGIVALVEGAGSIAYGESTLPVTNFLPGSTTSFTVLGAVVQVSQVVIVVLTIIAVCVLQFVFRRTRLGIAMHAVVENPDLADVQGTDPIRVRRSAWVLSTCLATFSGVLLLPAIGLDPVLFTYLFFTTFAGAALGMFDSIPLAYAGGIVIGVVSSMLSKVEFSTPALAGISASAPFIVLVVVMLVSPRRKLLPLNATERRPPLRWRGPLPTRIAAFVVSFGFLATVPLWTSGAMLAPYWMTAVVYIIWFLALGLLVHNAGLPSLCTLTFAAIGAVVSAHLGHHIGWIPGVIIAGLIAVPIGALVALPGIRLSGTFLALSTLGFALAVQYLFYARGWMFGTLYSGLPTPRPSFAQGSDAYYYLLLAAAAVAVGIFVLVNRSRLGRMLAGMNEAERAVGTLGLNVNMSRVLVFAISAFMASVAGALYSPIFGAAVSSSYLPLQSVVLLATLCVMPFAGPWYAVFGGITQVIPGYFPGAHTVDIMNVIFGLSAIVVATQGGPARMPVRWQRFVDEKFARRKSVVPAVEPAGVAATATRPAVLSGGHRNGDAAGLSVSQVTVRFGGLTAVSDASLEAPPGKVTALIGPNGAGKTTLFNTCSGLVKPASGSVTLGGKAMRAAPHARARLGLGRTFQIMQLCESMSVADNVALGREAAQAGSSPWTQLWATGKERRAREAAVREAIDLCELRDIADEQAGSLSTGQRRRVEFARCLAGDFDVLLLDEPSSGLDPDETRHFGEVLRRVVRERGCGILIVEHDMSLVMSVCDHLYVLDFGKMIFEGSPDAAKDSPVVKAAYLGGGREAEETLDVAISELTTEHDLA
jgi:ABC-type branched-subunit amino acid transport system ATPase component/branched-subunit amino acid ABC-type transport system permease component